MKFKIIGLDCAHCAAKLEHEFSKIEGVQEVSIDFLGQKIVCESDVDEHTLIHTMQDIANKMEDGIVIEKTHHHEEHCSCGHDHKHEHHHHNHHNHKHHHEEHCSCEHHEHHHDHECCCGHNHKHEQHHEHKGTKKLVVEGLDCANCAAKLERELQKVDGIHDLTVDFMGQRIVYSSELEESVVIHKLQDITNQVESGVVIRTLDTKQKETISFEYSMLVRILVASILLVMSFVVENYGLLFAIIGYVVIGYDIILRSIKNIFKGQWMDENFLMMIATFGAFYVQEFHEAVGVMLFYQVGEYFQDLAVKKSRTSITSLLDLKPDHANMKHGDHVHVVHPDKLRVHDVIVVYPSEKIPVDGVIIDGQSSLDMSMLTGESLPQEKGIHDVVLSGSINLQSVLTIEVTKEYAESTAMKILDLVQNSSSKKADAEKFITKFARYYTPIVVTIALVIAFVLPMISHLSFDMAMYRACIFLVVSCPCALVISIPLSFFGGIGGASAKGILLKGGNYLEALTKIDTLVFDKTGTITTGTFEVSEIVSNDDELLKMCAHLESHSLHPIAQSIVKTYGKEIDETLINDVHEISGYGLVGLYNDKELLVGNEKLMNEYHISYPVVSTLGTVVYVAYGCEYIGHLVIQDKIKDNSKTVVTKLCQLGLEMVMLSGDRTSIVKEVGSKVGISACYGELLPQDKVRIVEELMANGKKVAFVGDGMNDAPVLARCDVGIAMGSGSDAAIEIADVIIMKDSLDKLVEVKRIAHKTMSIVKQNIIFALGVKVLVMILGAIGIANMWLAVFADVGVALLAILNAMRALK